MRRIDPRSLPQVRHEVVPLGGGLDLVTPTLALKPGVLRESLNFECNVTGGYSRIDGYERFDGRAAPSTGTYVVLTASFVPAVVIAYGDTVTGSLSAQTGSVIEIGSDYLVIANPSGTFTVGEDLAVGATTVASILAFGYASSARNNAIYLMRAADLLRASIAKPAGSGAVRGVFKYNGVAYCFRDNAGGTAAVMFKSSASGWSAVTFFQEMSFSSGLVKPAEGATLYGNTSTATGTVKRVVTRTGSWGSTAAGTVVIEVTSGTFQNGESVKLTNAAGAVQFTAASASATITLAPGGHVETVEATIFGAATSRRVYGCDGVNTGWEFDGSVFVPIHTGMTTDTPKHVAAHKNHLFFSFGASVQYSSLADPYGWSIVTGAGELNAGEDATGFNVQPGDSSGGALAIYTRNNTLVLYGTPGGASMQLVHYNTGVGGLHYTAQNLVSSFVLDDRGVMNLGTSLNYGNFDTAALTYAIRPWVVEKRGLAQASCVNREKAQYRVFFSDGSGLYCTVVNGKFMGALPVFFTDPVFCAWSGEDSGSEVTLIGSNDGYVYELDSGTSFDGASIAGFITLNYATIKSPRYLKSYRKAVAEVFGTTYAELSASYKLGYSKAEYSTPDWATYSAAMMQGGWDGSVSWDNGQTWDSQGIAPVEIEMGGTAENVALSFSTDNAFSGPITITTAIIHYLVRRGLR